MGRILRVVLSLTFVTLALLGLHQLYQASAWPSLDEEPSLDLQPALPPTASWGAFEAAIIEVPASLTDPLQRALKGEGVPSERGLWREVSDQLDALEAKEDHQNSPQQGTPCKEQIKSKAKLYPIHRSVQVDQSPSPSSKT